MALPRVAITKAETGSVEIFRPKLNGPLVRSSTGGPLQALALAAVLVSAHEQGSLPGALLACAGIALAALFGTAIYLWWVRIELGDDAVRIRSFNGTRCLDRSEIWSVALRDVAIASAKRPVLILYSRDHRCLAIMDRRLWSHGTIEALAYWAGCSVPAAKPTTNKRLESEFAGSVPTWQRHPWLIGTTFVLALVLLVVVIHAA